MMSVVKKRTTLTLDPDVAARLDDEMHRQRKPLRQVVNEAIRRGLSGSERPRKPPAFRLAVHKSGLQPGLDALRLNRLADEIETEAFLDKHRRKKR